MPDTDTRTETVGVTDPRWAEHRVTVRQIDYWTRNEIIYVVGDPAPGSGYLRRWPVSEVEVAGRIVRLTDAGLTLRAAIPVARADGPVEIGPGITITVEEVAK